MPVNNPSGRYLSHLEDKAQRGEWAYLRMDAESVNRRVGTQSRPP